MQSPRSAIFFANRSPVSYTHLRFLRDACDYISLKPYHLFRLYNGFLSPFEYTFSAERFDTAAMYVGVSEKRLERGRIPVRAFPD